MLLTDNTIDSQLLERTPDKCFKKSIDDTDATFDFVPFLFDSL